MKIGINMTKNFAVRRTLILAGLLAMAGSSGWAIDLEDWTINEVLDKVVEANGGRDAINSIKDVRMRGSIKTPEVTYDFLLLKKRPNKLRVHLMYKGRSVETGFDGIEGWQRIWTGGEDTVRKLTKVELDETGLETDFDGPLIGPDKPLITRTLDRIERIDRTDYFVVKLEAPDSRTYHYVDSRTYREWKTVREVLGEDGEVTNTIETLFDDYAKYETIWIAETMTRTSTSGTAEEVIVTQVELNPGILDRAFVMPKQWSDSE